MVALLGQYAMATSQDGEGGIYPKTVRLSDSTLAEIEAGFMGPRDTWDDGVKNAIEQAMKNDE